MSKREGLGRSSARPGARIIGGGAIHGRPAVRAGCGGVACMRRASKEEEVAAGLECAAREGGAGKPGAKQTGGAAKTPAAAAKTAARVAPLFPQRKKGNN